MASKSRRNITFVLSSFSRTNTGIGGHYRSVKAFADILMQEHEVKVVTIGDLPSPVLQDRNYYTHIESRGLLDLKSLKRMKDKIYEVDLKAKPTVISVGTHRTYLYGELLSLFIPNSIRIHLKPGGKPTQALSLYDGTPFVCFSQSEKELFFSADPARPIMVLTARVNKIRKDEGYINRLERNVKEKGFVASKSVVAISRINRHKLAPLVDIIDSLTPLIRESEHNFFLIGREENSDVTEVIDRKLNKMNAKRLSDNWITDEASKALYIGDAFCGIGRSALEACSLGLPVFIPVESTKGPFLVMVTPDNWEIFASHNFTHRTQFSELKNKDLLTITDYFRDKPEVAKQALEMKKLFASELSTERSKIKWECFFNQVENIRKSSFIAIFIKLSYYYCLQVRNHLKNIVSTACIYIRR